jgi:hypothetical protein
MQTHAAAMFEDTIGIAIIDMPHLNMDSERVSLFMNTYLVSKDRFFWCALSYFRRIKKYKQRTTVPKK